MNVLGQKSNTDTPCVGICSTTSVGDSICVGCGRTALEVRDWNGLSSEDRVAINERLAAVKAGTLHVPIINWLSDLLKPFDVTLPISKIKDISGNSLLFNFTPESTPDFEAIKNLFIRVQRERYFNTTLMYILGDRYVAPRTVDMETLTQIKLVVANKTLSVLFLQNKPAMSSTGYSLNFDFI